MTATAFALSAAAERRTYLPQRLYPKTERRAWAAAAEAPDGTALAFGGLHQERSDPRGHTCFRNGGVWTSLYAELVANNPLQRFHARIWALRDQVKNATAKARYAFFQAHPADQQAAALAREVAPVHGRIAIEASAIADGLRARAPDLDRYERDQAIRAAGKLTAIAEQAHKLLPQSRSQASPSLVAAMGDIRIALEKAAEMVDAEPPPRALSPIAFDASTGLFVLFGGDHFDYLTNDIWVFDPALRKWMQRHPPDAPPPRANHVLIATGDGRVTVRGGYGYTSAPEYSGQYRSISDGEFVYDVAANRWSGNSAAALATADARTYRTGAHLPAHFLQGAPPDRASVSAKLDALAPNRWLKLDPPLRPVPNRDWGLVVLDAEHDIILRWAGGHSAHGGSDVVHYHLATNRWELPFPLEFPLGQSGEGDGWYLAGVNFNGRPWMPVHTYAAYAYDSAARRLVFADSFRDYYLYDPDVADWVGSGPRHHGMTSNTVYTQALVETAHGVVCWTKEGRLFRFDAKAGAWEEMRISGHIPGAVVDNSAIAYDSKRDRIVMIRRAGGTPAFDGRIYTVDLKTMQAKALSPGGMERAANFPAVVRLSYDPDRDLMLVGTTLPPDAAGVQRTPAYDPAGNRWVTLRLAGDQPATGHSMGLVYDKKRKLHWASDRRGQIWVLRLVPAAAGMEAL